MKSGSGDDPFADGEEVDEQEPSPDAVDLDLDAEESSPEPADADEDGSGALLSRDDLPYVLRRDGTKDGRDMVPLFLRDHVKKDETAFLMDVADQLGKDDSDVSTLDLREAMYRVARDHPDEVAEKLREDGYDLL